MSNRRKVKSKTGERVVTGWIEPPKITTDAELPVNVRDGIRRLTYALPRLPDDDIFQHRIVLLADDGTAAEVGRYSCERTFRLIQVHHGWWRLAGQDRETGEFIYLPDAA